jgi:hypothetical protein
MQKILGSRPWTVPQRKRLERIGNQAGVAAGPTRLREPVREAERGRWGSTPAGLDPTGRSGGDPGEG